MCVSVSTEYFLKILCFIEREKEGERNQLVDVTHISLYTIHMYTHLYVYIYYIYIHIHIYVILNEIEILLFQFVGTCGCGEKNKTKPSDIWGMTKLVVQTRAHEPQYCSLILFIHFHCTI